jgi:hypothetical protein
MMVATLYSCFASTQFLCTLTIHGLDLELEDKVLVLFKEITCTRGHGDNSLACTAATTTNSMTKSRGLLMIRKLLVLMMMIIFFLISFLFFLTLFLRCDNTTTSSNFFLWAGLIAICVGRCRRSLRALISGKTREDSITFWN